MKITSINKENFQNIEKFTTHIGKSSKPSSVENIDQTSITSETKVAGEWKIDILNSAIEKLANSIQPSDNHPLSLVSNYPIDDFTEALSELKKVKSEILSNEGTKAQANLDVINLLELFKD